ncbi:hypothetical protein ACFV2H_42735 [Streptomyces sp. NPDC059629]
MTRRAARAAAVRGYVKKAKSTWSKLVSNLKDLTHYINTMGNA